MSGSSVILGMGTCSSFGGPNDGGVTQMEGLSLVNLEGDDLSEWWFARCFLPTVGLGKTIGLARSLNPSSFYCAMRWNFGAYDGVHGEILPGYSRERIRRGVIRVTFEGKSVMVQALDWGPNTRTGRLIDLSPGAMAQLGARTDDVVGTEFFG